MKFSWLRAVRTPCCFWDCRGEQQTEFWVASNPPEAYTEQQEILECKVNRRNRKRTPDSP